MGILVDGRSHIECNLRGSGDYRHLSGYLRDPYQLPGVSETVDFDPIERHHYQLYETTKATDRAAAHADDLATTGLRIYPYDIGES